MTGFDDREKAFEAKFKQDQELQFRVIARRNKLLGLWAAEMLGMSGEEANAYAMEVAKSDFEAPGDDDVLQKVLGDLTNKNVEMTDHRLRKKMDDLIAEATNQIRNEVA